MSNIFLRGLILQRGVITIGHYRTPPSPNCQKNFFLENQKESGKKEGYNAIENENMQHPYTMYFTEKVNQKGRSEGAGEIAHPAQI